MVFQVVHALHYSRIVAKHAWALLAILVYYDGGGLMACWISLWRIALALALVLTAAEVGLPYQ